MSEVDWLDAFANNLVSFMRDANMTQGELSEAAGISQPALSSYINKQRMPGIKAVINLAYALGCDVAELIDFGDTII